MMKTITLVSAVVLLAACSGGADEAAPAGEQAGAMGGAMGAGGGMGGGDMGGPPDFSAAAAALGIDEATLNEAMRAAGGPPPDFAKAAAALGISEDALVAALPPRPE